jgi:GAF domain-containing protein
MLGSVTTQRDSLLWTLEEISHLVSNSGHPDETLTNIVRLIQRTFDTDVCSVYLLEPDRATLVLAATVGLRSDSVGRVRMRLSEGLAGLVGEQRPAAIRSTRHRASAGQAPCVDGARSRGLDGSDALLTCQAVFVPVDSLGR